MGPGDSGLTTVRLKPNPAPSRTALEPENVDVTTI